MTNISIYFEFCFLFFLIHIEVFYEVLYSPTDLVFDLYLFDKIREFIKIRKFSFTLILKFVPSNFDEFCAKKFKPRVQNIYLRER